MRKLFNFLTSRRRTLEQSLERELQYHVDRRAADLMESGLRESEARRQAAVELGGIAQVQDSVRDTWRWRWLHDGTRDIRYALRVLRASPGFTATAVLSLALGIGANTAVFTLIDAVLLKMLPVQNPQELVMLRWAIPEGRGPAGSRWMDGNSWRENGLLVGTSFSWPMYQRVRSVGTRDSGLLSDTFAFTDLRDFNVFSGGESSVAAGQLVSSEYFRMLGVPPAHGRVFLEEDDQLGAALVCVISDRYWKRRFGGDPAVIGSAIRINGAPTTVVGITPPEFFGVQPGRAFDVVLPLSSEPVILRLDPRVSLFSAADHWWVQIMARMKPGMRAEQTVGGLNAIFQQTTTAEMSTQSNSQTALASLQMEPGGPGISDLRRRFSRPLFVLMAMVGLLLVIACANVANLLLARAAARQREIGIRLSVGASRWRLIRQLLTESVLLACVGGAVGCAFAWWGSRLLVTLISSPGDPILLDVTPNLTVLFFTLSVCLLTGLFFGLAPAIRATRVRLIPALKGSKPFALPGTSRLDLVKALVVAQAALSVVLVFGATLFVRTVVNLQTVNTGFARNNLLVFGLDATQAGYKDRALKDFYGRVQQRLAALPGVVSVTSSLHLMLGGGTRRDRLTVPGYTPQPGERMGVYVLPAGADFFRTMKIPLLVGRDFSERDHDDAPKVAVVNEAFVKQYLAGSNPVGQRIGVGGAQADTEIVGVAADARYGSLRNDVRPTVYQPFRQTSIHMMHFEVRTAGNPKALIPDVRRGVASLDPGIPLQELSTQEEKIDEMMIQERLFAKLSTVFGAVALALVCVGLYGILAFGVARRTGEIGVRMALGAKAGAIVRMVLKETLLVTALGLILGVIASIAAVRWAASLISDLLYGLKSNDGVSLVIAAAALMLAAALASFVPARRASRIHPMTAIRYE